MIPYSQISSGLSFLDREPTILAGFSRREDGGMSINRGDPDECVSRRTRFFKQVGIPLSKTVWAELTHSNHVAIVSTGDAGRGSLTGQNAIHDTDGLWTRDRDLSLCTTHADCIPLYFLDPMTPAVGVAHCGWRSCVSGLPGKMIEAARREWRTKPEQIRVGIGPGIRVECFEIGSDIVDSFPSEAITPSEGKWFANLPEVIRCNLVEAGVPISNIEDSGICSQCTPVFSSYRRDRDQVAPAVAFIQIRLI